MSDPVHIGNDPVRIGIALFVLLYSVIIHEMSHALSALRLGDPSGKEDNRFSWNPLYHIDPIMTILVPIMTLAIWGFPFGGAKPVQVNPLRFRNPGQGMMITAAAGPITNMLLAAAAMLIALLLAWVAPDFLFRVGPRGETLITYNGFFLFYAMWINLVLAAFNLIPIPPLDGSRVLRYLLPQGGKDFIDRFESFGLIVIVLLISAGGTAVLIGPVVRLHWDLFLVVLRTGMS